MPTTKALIYFIPLFFLCVFLLHQFLSEDWYVAFLTVCFVVPLMWISHMRFNQKQQIMQLEQQALHAEMTMLKNQINPHFFFNTLNNLYSLTVTKSDQAPELILKLSDLMRFTIYEGSKEMVPLEAEVNYLKNYLAIQQIRLREKRCDIDFEAHIFDPKQRIPPLLFIVLLENAFKHGVAKKDRDAHIKIQLTTRQNGLEFRIENTCEDLIQQPGIGIQNLQRRLALTFPNKHLLSLKQKSGVFQALLKLEWNT